MSIRIGIDLGGTKVEGIVLDGRREVGRRRVPTPRTYPATIDAIASLVESLEREIGVEGKTGTARPTIGMGIPGSMVPATGLVKNASSTWLIGQPLQTDLEHRLGRQIRVTNDANCFAVSEATDGAGAGAEVVFGVIIGTGTGSGIVVRGQVITGPNGIAGEWGHNPLPWPRDEERPGRSCFCGKSGCIESFLSGPGLQADHEAREGIRRSPAEIAAAAAAGDPLAQAAMSRYEERMARALASIINVLDPDVIVLGGGVSNIPSLYENVPTLWNPWVFTNNVVTRLVQARHGDSSGVRGAAWLWPE